MEELRPRSIHRLSHAHTLTLMTHVITQEVTLYSDAEKREEILWEEKRN